MLLRSWLYNFYAYTKKKDAEAASQKIFAMPQFQYNFYKAHKALYRDLSENPSSTAPINNMHMHIAAITKFYVHTDTHAKLVFIFDLAEFLKEIDFKNSISDEFYSEHLLEFICSLNNLHN